MDFLASGFWDITAGNVVSWLILAVGAVAMLVRMQVKIEQVNKDSDDRFRSNRAEIEKLSARMVHIEDSTNKVNEVLARIDERTMHMNHNQQKLDTKLEKLAEKA